MSALPSGMRYTDALGPKEVTWAPSPHALMQGWAWLSVPPHTKVLRAGTWGLAFPGAVSCPLVEVWAAGKNLPFGQISEAASTSSICAAGAGRGNAKAALVSPLGVRTGYNLPLQTRGSCQGIRAMKAMFLPKFEGKKKNSRGFWGLGKSRHRHPPLPSPTGRHFLPFL